MYHKNNPLHKVLASTLVLVLVFSLALPGTFAFADDTGAAEGPTPGFAEAQDSVEDLSRAHNPTESSVTSLGFEPATDSASLEGETPDFVFIEFSELSLLETQNIVVALPVEADEVASAELTLVDLYTGQTLVLPSEAIAQNALLFTCIFFDNSEMSTYALQSLTYCIVNSDEQYQIVFDIEEDALRFDVVPNVPGQTDFGFYTIDEEGNLSSVESIEEALDVSESASLAEEDTGLSDNPLLLPLSSQSTSPQQGNVVVALDPGHGGTDPGAVHNGMLEKDLNLKIANYCRTELLQYVGVTVFMTRTTDEFVGLTERVNRAVAAGATVFISIHNNAGGGTGSEVWVPNQSSYNYGTHVIGDALARQILARLAALGLANRGVKTRDFGGATYPDGSITDYYTVISASRLFNLPAVIVEYAFMDNSNDAAFLSVEANLQRLGIATATGIASYYGLAKWDWNPTISVVVAPNHMNVTITVAGTGAPAGLTQVRVPVWGRQNGQNDLIWYNAVRQGNGDWVATVPILSHRESGTYDVHVYAVANSTQKLVGSATFSIAPFTPTIAIQNNVGATFDVVVSSNTPSGLSSVLVPVWSTPNQSNLVWYNATRQANGTYRATVNIANHGNATGTYQVHVYSTAGNGLTGGLATTTATTNLPAVSVTATVTSNQMNTSIRVSGGLLPTASSVVVPVWRLSNQGDLVWYPAQRQADGSWIATVTTSNHRLAGTYTAHAYATIAGSFNHVGGTTFNIASFTPTIAIQNNVGATFDVVVSSNTPSGLSSVLVPVWSTPNQSNLVWYNATRQANGTYRATVNIANHGYVTGTYQVHVYSTATNGVAGNLAATTATTNLPAVSATATVTSNQMNTSIRVSGGLLPSASSVVVPVWRLSNQGDLVWYPAQRQADGSWIATVTTANHRLAGTYTAHVYATIAGSFNHVAATSFNIASFTPTITIQNNVGSTFDVVVSSNTPSGLSSVLVPVWSTPNQSNLVWYNATRQANGTYRATVNVANHGFATGTYQVHVYATAANGVAGNLATTTATTNIPAVSVTATVTSNQMNASIRVSGGYLPSASSVVVPVWRSANQSDLIWYPAQRQADGSWIATVTTSNHKLTGTYTAHVYATISGVQNHVGGTTFTIASPTATVAVRNINEVAGTFEVVTSNINSPSGVVAVQVPVWSNTNQSDIIWHNARNMGNGTWVATINIRDHVYSTTTARSYLAHVYLTPGHGARTHVGSTLASVQFKGSDSAIMGSSQTTVAQMVNYFNSTGRPYPAAVYTQYGAPNITAWCQILLEEANREGVRAEVVFCQAMKETGWLQFGGQVSVGQCNFGGLGATNGGAAGADFSGYGADGVRIGLRAQVQHLKGYATTIPASQFASPIVSPRFHLLEQLGYRGIAPTLEGLNGRWAVPGTTYGQDILAMINFLFAYPR